MLNHRILLYAPLQFQYLVHYFLISISDVTSLRDLRLEESHLVVLLPDVIFCLYHLRFYNFVLALLLRVLRVHILQLLLEIRDLFLVLC